MRKYVILLFLLLTISNFASEPIKIGIISDIHFMSRKLVMDGTAYSEYQNATGRNMDDLHAVLEHVLSDFEKEKIDILLIPGDITNHGERQSHIDFIEKVKPLQQQGTRVIVIPGNHDINVPNAKAYIGDTPTPTQSISAKEFTQLYEPFGYGDALKRDTASLSYLTEINKNTWLLCFDTNRYAENKTTSISGGRIRPQTMNWALEILGEAKTKNITVLAMMHHGIVEHLPYQATFFPNHLLSNWKSVAETLVDAGVKVVFTGHFHSNDISQITTSAGNTLYDVETGSLAQYPFPYRLLTLDSSTLSIDTRFVDSTPETPDLQEKHRKITETIVRRGVKSHLAQTEIPIAGEAREALIELLIRIQMLHVKGDEVLDAPTLTTIKQFAEIMGSDEFDVESFQLDFPPADNRLVIDLSLDGGLIKD